MKWLIPLLILIAPLTHADVLMVEGEVLESEPVYETRLTEVVPRAVARVAPPILASCSDGISIARK